MTAPIRASRAKDQGPFGRSTATYVAVDSQGIDDLRDEIRETIFDDEAREVDEATLRFRGWGSSTG